MAEKKPSNPKDAVGCRKPGLSSIPRPVLYEVGAGMTEGAVHYGRHNYRVVGVRASIYYDAANRHLDRWWEGEDVDPDSGVHHISKAIAGLIVLRDAMMRGMVSDDRPPRTPDGWLAPIQDTVDAILARYPEEDRIPPYTQANLEAP